jgi:spore germination protein YaaH
MASASIRATHIAAILAEVDAYGYDGVDIDYENLAASSRAGFTSFMTDLARELHARGKVLTCAVWSKTSEPGAGVSQSQDWPALGQVVDRFKIMTYGYGWSGGPARPIGPVWRSEGILRFATSVMDPARVYYAIPFYGFRWPSTGANATAVTYQQAEALRAQHGAAVTFDAYHGEATFAYTDANGVSWTVWYQTPAAIEAKLELAKLVGVGGVAIWRLGGEAESFWQTIRRERAP